MKTFKEYITENLEPKYLWHISNQKFNKFDPYMTAQGIIWFARDKEDLTKNLHGANINSRNPIWLYKAVMASNKVAGWDEYDKYSLGQLRDMGYDSIDLDGDVAVLDVDKIKIVDVTQITMPQ